MMLSLPVCQDVTAAPTVASLPYAVSIVNVLPVGRAFHDAAVFDEKAVLEGHDDHHRDESDGGASDGEGPEGSDLARAMFDENYYEVLGLGELGCNANEEQIKKAYRKLLLKHHPDKKVGQAPTTETDPVFLAIQKAYDVLSDPDKRRGYDSQFDFDDSIPGEFFKGDFYEVFGPVFERNSRFSTKKPVPKLGDDSTSEAEVNSFYKFWMAFDSWRDFSQFAEHNPEDAEMREEKRWMERQNAAANKKRKKKEIQRIATLTERAYSHDPRIARYKEAAKKRKDEAKAAKVAARKAAEDKKAAALAEKRKAEEEAASQKQAEAAAAKKKKAQEAKALRNERKRLRTTITKVPVSDIDAAGVAVEYLCMRLTRDQLCELNDRLDSVPEADLMAAIAEAEAAERGVEAAKRANTKARLAAAKAEERAASASLPWTDDEVSALAKAFAKFPGGARNRWQSIANYIQSQAPHPDGVERTPQECIAKSQAVEEERRTKTLDSNPLAATGAVGAPSKGKAKGKAGATAAAIAASSGKAGTKAGFSDAATPPASADGGAGDSSVDPSSGADETWTIEQQAALEAALVEFPSSMDKNERWKAIASKVDGKTKKGCIARFKVLREKLKAAKK